MITKKLSYLSALVSIPTFCRILWHKFLMSRSLHMSLTSVRISSVSLSPWMSFLDRFRISWTLESIPSSFEGGLRKVGEPSTVVTNGFVKPPRSNSWAEIFRTGVPDPEMKSELKSYCKKKQSFQRSA